MKTRWLVFLWPLLFGWPLLVVWRGPSENYQPPAPYKIGDITLQVRDNPLVRDLWRGIQKGPVKHSLPGCKVKGKLPASCRKPVFLYLLSWQADPLQVRIMLLNLNPEKHELEALNRACLQFPPPSSLGNAGQQSNAIWQGACKKIADMKALKDNQK